MHDSPASLSTTSLEHPARAAGPLLRMEGIDKSFPGVQALADAKFDLYAGEVHALMGENGAGKSTLIRVLAGAHPPDAGRIVFDGKDVRIDTPRDAQRLGIAVIYQELNLVPTLSVRANLFLGRERTRFGFTSTQAERRAAQELFDRLGMSIEPEALCGELPVAHQQVVEIAKAISLDARVIVMDEPTAALTVRESERLFGIVKQLTDRGTGVVYVSHRMEEVFRLANRITVMRDGRHVVTAKASEITRPQLIEKMVGRTIDNEFPKERAEIGEPRLRVRNLSRGDKVRDVSFDVRRGEVLGFTGLAGAGRTEVARLLFGADPADAGSVTLDGKPLRLRRPKDAIRAGISLLTEDRKAQGLVLGLSVRENFALPNLSRFIRFGLLSDRAERTAYDAHAKSLRIKAARPDAPVRNLSGGNQQKVVLAKWLEADAEVVIFDEPTRGIDAGAKYEIYQLICNLARAGKAIIMISSELPEVLGMSDRVIVMHEGRITGEIAEPGKATQQEVMELAMR